MVPDKQGSCRRHLRARSCNSTCALAFSRPSQVAILDEQCNVLPPGQIGEVCIRGPNVTQGYKDNPKANEEAFAGGRAAAGSWAWLFVTSHDRGQHRQPPGQ